MVRPLVAAVVTIAAMTCLCSETFAMGDGRRHRHRPTSAGDYGTFSPNGTNTAVPLLDDQGSANRPLSSVPEPTTLLLLASGAAGFVSWMRRRM